MIKNVEVLRQAAELVSGGSPPEFEGELANGAFFNATLLRCEHPAGAQAVHAVEAFGPVATLMPYDRVEDATALANAGKGSLVLSLFTRDLDAITQLVGGTSASHGRIMIVDRDNAQLSSGHGAALPHLQHGGPGRAGGGAELGGTRGMMPYLQRSAIQASADVLAAIEGC